MILYEKKEHEDGSINFEQVIETINPNVKRLSVDYNYLRRECSGSEALELLRIARQYPNS